MYRVQSRTELDFLLRLIDEGFDRPAWHGPNLRGSIRGVTVTEASWRPATQRHSIRDIVLHAAYWKYTVRRRLLNEKRGSFPLKGSNWFVRPGSFDKAIWDEEVNLLEETHHSMREAVANMDPTRLSIIPKGKIISLANIISGIAFHDIYHAGQIQLIKRLRRES